MTLPPNMQKAMGGDGVNLVNKNGSWTDIWAKSTDPDFGIAEMKRRIDAAKTAKATYVRLFFMKPDPRVTPMTMDTWLGLCRQVLSYIAQKGLYLLVCTNAVVHTLNLANLGDYNTANQATLAQVQAGCAVSLAFLKVAKSYGNLIEAVDIENEFVGPQASDSYPVDIIAQRYVNFMRMVYNTLKADPQVGNLLYSWSNGDAFSGHPILQPLYPWLVPGTDGGAAFSDEVLQLHNYPSYGFGINDIGQFRDLMAQYGQGHVPPANTNLPIFMAEYNVGPVVSTGNDISTRNTPQQRADILTQTYAACDHANATPCYWAIAKQSVSPTPSEDWGLVNLDMTPRTGAYEVFQAHAGTRQAHAFVPTPIHNTRRRRH